MLTDDNKAPPLTDQDAPRVNGGGKVIPIQPEAPPRSLIVPGGTFALDVPEKITALWGNGDDVIWARGEYLVIVAPPGVGKTTLAQRLVRSMLTLDPPELLGLPVAPVDKGVLYIAADRPVQAQRSLHRMCSEHERGILDELLHVHRGPLGYDIARAPERFVEWVSGHDIDVLIVDCLKDVTTKMSDEETGGGIARAFNLLTTAGIDVAGLHHQRKAQGDNKKPNSLDDVYGSTWITSGAGSVLLLWGAPGDPLLEVSQLKMPAGEVGPLQVEVDHVRGTVTRAPGVDLLDFLRKSMGGLSVHQAAKILYGEKATRAQDMKVRRKLDQLVTIGLALKSEPGGRTGTAIMDGGIYTAAVLRGLEI